MKIHVLGPLVVENNDISAVPSAPKPRQVLALLVLQANRIVRVSALQKELWGEEPPPSALTTLQTYILQLRKALSSALRISVRQVAQEVLVTQQSGYTFVTRPGDEVDVTVFECLAREGRDAYATDQTERASDLLRRAVSLWRGEPLPDVRRGQLLEAHAARLEEAWLNVTEQRIAADVRLGRHHEVLTELAALTVEHRFNENLHAQFMLALYCAGRRPQALQVFQNFRHLMIEDLGLDPSPQLQQLQVAMLTSDPSLDQLVTVPARSQFPLAS